jgi:3-oxoacyl-[acyl-carrier protein] reductase
MKLQGKVAIVTASAGAGIGQAALRALAREGAGVVVADTHERRTGEVAEALKSEGYKAIGVVCDVTDPEQVENAVKQTLSQFGRIDILVNNAGINRLQPVHEMTDENWDVVIDTNLKGTFYFTRAVLPTMIEQNYGRIVNISSIAGWSGSNQGEAPYCAAKAGIMAFTRCVALETAKYDITANAVAPGFVPNPFLLKIYPPEALQAIEKMIPKGRGANPEEIANVILFLVSPEGSYITAETIAVSGGWR